MRSVFIYAVDLVAINFELKVYKCFLCIDFTPVLRKA
jgi:hypothetical protein